MAIASPRPIELNSSMSWRSPRPACSRSAGRPVSSIESAGDSAASSASSVSSRVTTSPSRGGLFAEASSRATSSVADASAESRWPNTSGWAMARAFAAWRSSSVSGPSTCGITGSTAPAAPWRRTSNIDRTCSTPAVLASRSVTRRSAKSDVSSNRSPERAVARTMQSRSEAPKRAATSSTRRKSASASRSRERRSSSIRSRDNPIAASSVRMPTAAVANQRQSQGQRQPGRLPKWEVSLGGDAIPPGRRSIPCSPTLHTGRESPRPRASCSR